MLMSDSKNQSSAPTIDHVSDRGVSGILPRETPSRMSIPALNPPKKERELPATKPTESPNTGGPTPLMILVLVLVAAMTGVILALLTP